MSTGQLTAKEYLSQAYHIDQRIHSKIVQVQSLHDLATKATTTLTDMPGNATRNVHSMEDVIVKMVDLESEISENLERLLALKNEIITVITCVDVPELQTLLEMRYLCFNTWEQIAVALHVNVRHVYRLHGSALAEVELIRRHR